MIGATRLSGAGRNGLALLAGALLTFGQPVQAQTSAEVMHMRAAVALDGQHNVELLRQLVEQNSGTMNVDGVRRVGELVRAELEALGFRVRWEGGGAFSRAGHLIATHAGAAGGSRVLMVGHLDTVFEPDSGFHGFVRDGDIARGPGVGDDKGGIVVIIAALRAMRAAGSLAQANVTVYLTGDEERIGSPVTLARAGLVAAAQRADYALEYEGLASVNGSDYATVARRGAATWELRTTGTAGHSRNVGEAGYGAIYELARIVDAFTTIDEPDVTINVGLVAGGADTTMGDDGSRAVATGKVNVVARSAVARGDLRTTSLEQDARVRATMTAITAAHRAGTGAALTFIEGYPPMAATSGNRAILVQLNAVNDRLGLGFRPIKWIHLAGRM